MAVSVPARADWPYVTLIYAGTEDETFPIEAAIRQSPDSSTYGEAWIAYTLHTTGPNEPDDGFSELFLAGYRCTAGCATSTAGDVEEIGTDLWGPHLMQPSLAIRRVGSNPIEFTVVRSEKVFTDCNGVNGVAGPSDYDEIDQKSADLVAHELTNPGNLGSFTAVDEWDVSTNSTGVCGDRGLTSTRYHGGDTWTCYTHTPDYNDPDVVSCNSNVGATGGAWIDEFDMPTAPNPEEDHPDFEFIGDDRIVATSNRTPGNLAAHANDKIRLVFPDQSGSTPIISITGTNWLNHPRVEVQNELAQLVWHRGNSPAAADLLYSFCQADTGGSPAVLCDSGGQWASPVVPESGHDEKYPQIAVDGDFTMIAYTAIDEETGKHRVYVITSCGSEAPSSREWSAPEMVRTNTLDTQFQSMAFGRPGLVLNKDANVAHIVLLDGLDVEDAEKGPSNASLYWYRKAYSDCSE